MTDTPHSIPPAEQHLDPLDTLDRVADAIAEANGTTRDETADAIAHDRLRTILNRYGVEQFRTHHRLRTVSIDPDEAPSLGLRAQLRGELTDAGYYLVVSRPVAAGETAPPDREPSHAPGPRRLDIADGIDPKAETLGSLARELNEVLADGDRLVMLSAATLEAIVEQAIDGRGRSRGEVDFVTGERRLIPAPPDAALELDLDDPDLDGVVTLDEGHLDALSHAAHVAPAVRLGRRTIEALVAAARHGLDARARATFVDPQVREADLRIIVAALPQHVRVALLDGLGRVVQDSPRTLDEAPTRDVLGVVIATLADSFIEEPF